MQIKEEVEWSLFRFLTKTSALGQGLLVLGDQSFRSASTFLSAMLVGRACGRAEYGFYTLLLTLLVTAEAFQAALVSTPYVVQNPSKRGPDKAVHLGNAVVIQLLVAAGTAFFLLGLLHTIPLAGTGDLSPRIVPAFALAYFAVLWREFFRQVLLADLEVGWNLAFGVAVHGSLIAVLLGLFWVGKLSAWTAYVALAGCCLVPTMSVLWCRRRRMRLELNGLVGQFLEYWHVGRWLFAQAVLMVVSGPVYSWVLASSRGAAAVGLLGACLLPGSVMSPLVQAIHAFLLPKASHAVPQGIDHVRRIVLRSSLGVGLTFLLFPILLGWFSVPIMKLLFADKYDPSGWLVAFLALRSYLVVTAVPLTVGLVVCKQAYFVFKSEMVSLTLTALLGLPLTYALGVWGVAWGFLLTRLCSRLYLAWAFRQHVRSSSPPTVMGVGDELSVSPAASI
jgi:O-antigen/teichoic acid export membrane protein